ncbi:MAG: 3-phosphoshikimate 1-carboxyvinyltransferase, partial [Rickettsiales bacterium]|nr:3-phosphoshikimate 1-carboxyvinyltransferase [Rickettsiales bacterium]
MVMPPLHKNHSNKPSPHASALPLRSSGVSFFKGDISVPGDKSISHRALMLSSQVLGTTTISGLLEGEDVLNTAAALSKLGVNITQKAAGLWEVQGVGIGGLAESADVLDMGNSGTSTRLLMGLLTPYPFISFFTGDHSLRGRPMNRVMTPLAQMGAKFTARTGGKLPLALQGTPDTMPITYRLPVASAQVKSAILLAALNTPGRSTVVEPSPTRDHTENMLTHLGYEIEVKKHDDGEVSISLSGQQPSVFASRDIHVPGDPSSAAFAVVAALI